MEVNLDKGGGWARVAMNHLLCLLARQPLTFLRRVRSYQCRNMEKITEERKRKQRPYESVNGGGYLMLTVLVVFIWDVCLHLNQSDSSGQVHVFRICVSFILFFWWRNEIKCHRIIIDKLVKKTRFQVFHAILFPNPPLVCNSLLLRKRETGKKKLGSCR